MARAKKIVLDASVAVKWFNQEKSTSTALKIRELHIDDKLVIHAPELLLFEVVNALRWKPDYDQDDVLKVYESLQDLMINFIKIKLDLAIEYAFKYELTVYDTAYMALAKELGVQLVTADSKLCHKVNDEKFIVDIEDYAGMENI